MTIVMATPWTVTSPTRSDRDELHRLFSACSLETVTGRFFAPVRRLPAGYVEGVLSQRPYEHDAAVVRYGDGIRIAAVASIVRADDTRRPTGELGVLVGDAWQRRGLGRALVRHLAARAVDRGVAVLAASVLPGRSALLDALTELGPLVSIDADSDGVTGRFELAERV